MHDRTFIDRALQEYQHSTDSTAVIADRLGVSMAMLTVWAKDNGVPLRQRGRNKADAPSEADRHRLELIAGGMTQEAVAKDTDISKQRMSRIVRRWRSVLQEIKQELASRPAEGQGESEDGQAWEVLAVPPTAVHPVSTERENSIVVDAARVNPAHSQAKSASTSEAATLTNTTQEPVAASSGTSVLADEKGEPARDGTEAAAPSFNNGFMVAPTAKAANEDQAGVDKHTPTKNGASPSEPKAESATDTVIHPAEQREVNRNLSKTEQALLSECEAIIDEKRQVFFELGEALRKVRDGKLYRQHHATFEEYCRKRWDFTRAWAYFQIKAVTVREICQPLVDIESLPGPSNERQVRPLASLEPEQQRAGWRRAVELADGKEVTGSLVEKAVRELKAASIIEPMPADAFDPDRAWKGLEKRLALWPDHLHSDLRARLQAFTERLSASAGA